MFNNGFTFEGALIGQTEDGTFVYDASKMARWLMTHQWMEREEAEAWIEYQEYCFACSGEPHPIIVYRY